MKEYNNRKKMLGSYLVDYDWTYKSLKEIKKEISEIHDNDYNFTIETTALSFGLYGMNGGVFSVFDENHEIMIMFTIESRTSVLWELV